MVALFEVHKNHATCLIYRLFSTIRLAHLPTTIVFLQLIAIFPNCIFCFKYRKTDEIVLNNYHRYRNRS